MGALVLGAKLDAESSVIQVRASARSQLDLVRAYGCSEGAYDRPMMAPSLD
jgi:hypothetical protein